MDYAEIQANAPKIIANTFQGEKDVATLSYREETTGTVQVMFEGVVHTVKAKFMSFEGAHGIICAFGFSALGMNKKAYKLSISYRTKTEEHNVQVGGNVVKIHSMFKDAA